LERLVGPQSPLEISLSRNALLALVRKTSIGTAQALLLCAWTELSRSAPQPSIALLSTLAWINCPQYKGAVHALSDIFSIWISQAEFARDLQLPYQRVAKWAQRERIPPEAWPAVIDAAKRKKVVLTTSILARANKPRRSAAPNGPAATA
jgi:hypothetical protein